MGLFQRAVKRESKLRLAIAGPSGAGKTYSALAIGTALADGQPVAVVDTEHGSASKYADLFSFDVAEMHAPYHPDKFCKALEEAANAGYAVVILDSISHAWIGSGGMLDIVEEIGKRSKSGNSFAAWKDATPVHNRMLEAIVSAPIHVIFTMRSKQEYILAEDSRGKQAPRKVGMAPVQRDGTEYEADVFLDMDIENNAIVQKTRCPELTGRVFTKPGKDIADILREWLHGAPVTVQAEATQPAPTPQPAPATSNADDVQFMADDEPEPDNPFAADADVTLPDVNQWEQPSDAYNWAIEIGACDNEHEAKNSMKKVTEQVTGGGGIKKSNKEAVYRAFAERQLEKLEAEPA